MSWFQKFLFQLVNLKQAFLLSKLWTNSQLIATHCRYFSRLDDVKAKIASEESALHFKNLLISAQNDIYKKKKVLWFHTELCLFSFLHVFVHRPARTLAACFLFLAENQNLLWLSVDQEGKKRKWVKKIKINSGFFFLFSGAVLQKTADVPSQWLQVLNKLKVTAPVSACFKDSTWEMLYTVRHNRTRRISVWLSDHDSHDNRWFYSAKRCLGEMQ